MKEILTPVSPGELIDKITILQIKRERIVDERKRQNVLIELNALTAARDAAIPASAEMNRLAAELKTVNEKLWEVEDDIRLCDRDGDFGPRFVELARSVYYTNDRRCAIKRQINEILGSLLVEEKSYSI
jgi:hypothetical protein